MMKLRSALAAMVIATSPVISFSEGGIGTLGYADRGGIKGAEIQLGYRKQFSAFGVNILPLTGIWYQKDDSRYREETFSNGNTVCRDRTNGQFADDEKCGASFSYAFIASTDYALSEAMAIGAGVRIGKDSDAFLSARIKVGQSLSLLVQGGGKYVSASLALGF